MKPDAKVTPLPPDVIAHRPAVAGAPFAGASRSKLCVFRSKRAHACVAPTDEVVMSTSELGAAMEPNPPAAWPPITTGSMSFTMFPWHGSMTCSVASVGRPPSVVTMPPLR